MGLVVVEHYTADQEVTSSNAPCIYLWITKFYQVDLWYRPLLSWIWVSLDSACWQNNTDFTVQTPPSPIHTISASEMNNAWRTVAVNDYTKTLVLTHNENQSLNIWRHCTIPKVQWDFKAIFFHSSLKNINVMYKYWCTSV